MDEEALKTLKRIESLLSKSMVASNRPSIAGGKNVAGKAATTFPATAKSLKGIDNAARSLTASLTGLNKQVRTSRASFYSLNKTMKGMSPVQSATTNNTILGRLNGMLRGVLGGGNGNGRNTNAGTSALFGPAPRQFTNSLSASNLALVFFATQLRALGKPLADITNDIYHLQARGISAADSLAGLYIDAARAGMSLGEYTKALETAETSLVRSGSFSDFNQSLRGTTDQLKSMGIFGSSAIALSVSMREAGTELGISQRDLSSANTAQLSVLERLRTSGMMTAESFLAVVKQLQESEVVQNSLLGLAPRERAARLTQLTQMATFGKQMGLSTEASKRLGEAFINQRNSTLGQRMEASARIQQAAASLGMNSADAANLARLSRRKNLTPQDQAMMMPLAGQLQQLLQARLNDDTQPVVQGIYEEVDNLLSSTVVKDILKTSGQAAQVMSSGEKANADFAKATPDFLQGARTLLQWADGVSKNPLGTLISGAIGGALGTAAFGFGMAKGFGLILPKLLPTLGVGKVAGSVASAAGSLMGPMQPFFKGLTGTLISGLGNVLKSVAAWIAPAIGAIVEGWTGDINAALGGGDWIDRINNIVFAAARAIPAAITSLFDSVFGTGITGWLDKALTMARAGFQILINGIVDSVIDLIPDSFTPQWMKDWSDNGHKKLETMFQTMDKLMADSSSTLTTIGAKNQEVMLSQVQTAKSGVEKIKALHAQTSNVIYGTDGITANVLQTAREMQSGRNFAIPGQISRPMITPPTVNTEQQAPQSNQQQVQSPQVASILATPGVAELLTQLVTLMQQSLAVETQHTDLTAQLLRAGNRPNLGNNETLVRQVLKNAG